MTLDDIQNVLDKHKQDFKLSHILEHEINLRKIKKIILSSKNKQQLKLLILDLLKTKHWREKK